MKKWDLQKQSLIVLNQNNAKIAEAKATRHTLRCVAARENERIARAAYEKRWPRYCRRCDGEGGSSGREYRGECHGVPAYESTYDYCPNCIEKSVCPRCGSISNNFEDDDVEQLRCATCDWRKGDPGAPEILNPYDCGCLI